MLRVSCTWNDIINGDLTLLLQDDIYLLKGILTINRKL